jgi:hypothetical protein
MGEIFFKISSKLYYKIYLYGRYVMQNTLAATLKKTIQDVDVSILASDCGAASKKNHTWIEPHMHIQGVIKNNPRRKNIRD